MSNACLQSAGTCSRGTALGSARFRLRTVGRRNRCGRYALVSAKKKKNNADAVGDILQWTQSVQSQVAELRTVLTESQKSNAENTSVNTEISQGEVLSSMEGILKDLMDRQQNFFNEERAYWLKEREEWRAQEATLRTEIARLQDLLLSRQATEDDPPSPNSTEAAPVPPQAPENVFSMKMNVQESIRTAMSAVDAEDVLSEKFDNLLHMTTNGISSTTPNDASSQPQQTETEPEPADEQKTVETVRSPPTGPPPVMSSGDDDIYWVSQLQEALNQKGYYCGDDDVDDFYFGEGTLSALLTFQACTGLTETGTTELDTWTALLGKDLTPVIGDTPETERAPQKENVVKDFPVLSEMDGGRDVHCLQVMLELAGYSCGKDDMMWWHYGDETINAMKTFQACHGLPQSGVADVSAWKILAGSGNTMADVVKRVKEEDIYEEDLTNTDRVWLLGEQRWERKL